MSFKRKPEHDKGNYQAFEMEIKKVEVIRCGHRGNAKERTDDDQHVGPHDECYDICKNAGRCKLKPCINQLYAK
jgi:hypothetical protein